jgi:hypothetical protein
MNVSVNPPPIQKRLVLAVCALLLAVLPAGAGTLRVCLHDWVEFRDACHEVAAVDRVSDGCCPADREEPTGSALGRGHECQGCCIEIACEGDEVSATPSAAGGPAFDVALPALCAVERAILPPVDGPARRDDAPPRAPPGRAPTPLRI